MPYNCGPHLAGTAKLGSSSTRFEEALLVQPNTPQPFQIWLSPLPLGNITRPRLTPARQAAARPLEAADYHYNVGTAAALANGQMPVMPTSEPAAQSQPFNSLYNRVIVYGQLRHTPSMKITLSKPCVRIPSELNRS